MILKLTLVLLFLLSGCNGRKVEQKLKMNQMNIPDIAYIYKDANKDNFDHAKLIAKTNSIWSKEYFGRNFYHLPNVYQVGDIIKIKIKVDTKAEFLTGIRKDKLSKSQVNSTFARILDKLLSLLGPGVAQMAPIFQTENNSSNNYISSGSTNKKENISSEISTIVRYVLPNGNLVIGGSQEIRVNNDKRIICLAGLIRKEDIDNDNSIDSAKIAEARVEYIGEGVLSDAPILNAFYKTYIDHLILLNK